MKPILVRIIRTDPLKPINIHKASRLKDIPADSEAVSIPINPYIH